MLSRNELRSQGRPPSAASAPSAVYDAKELAERSAAAGAGLEAILRQRRGVGLAPSAAEAAALIRERGLKARPRTAATVPAARDLPPLPDTTFDAGSRPPTRSASASAHRSRPGTSATYRRALGSESWPEEQAIAALDLSLRSGGTLQDLRATLAQAQAAEDTGPCRTVAERYEAVKRTLQQQTGPADDDMAERKASRYPGVAHLTGVIFRSADAVIAERTREASGARASVATEALREAVREAQGLRQEAEELRAADKDKDRIIRELRSANDAHEAQQRRLEAFVHELRIRLATATNEVLPLPKDTAAVVGSARSDEPAERPAGVLYPDHGTPEPYADAVRRLAAEVEGLRAENGRVAEAAVAHAEAYTRQSEEMAELLDKANGFQLQSVQLKATLRTMKRYIDDLEARVVELGDAFTDAQAARYAVVQRELEAPHAVGDAALTPGPMLAAAQHPVVLGSSIPAGAPHAVGGNTDALAAVAWHVLQLKFQATGAALMPRLALTTRVSEPAELDAQLQLLRHSCERRGVAMPAHLAATTTKLKLKPGDLHVARQGAVDCFALYAAAVKGRPWGTHDPFSATLRRAFKAPTARAAMEAAMSQHYLCSVFARHSVECLLFEALSEEAQPGDLLAQLPTYLGVLRRRLQLVEPTSKKQRDKIPRAELLAAVRDVMTGATEAELLGLALATVAVQEGKLGPDVNYEPFLDMSAAPVYEQIVRAAMAAGARVSQRTTAAVADRAAARFRTERSAVAAEHDGARHGAARQLLRLEPLDRASFGLVSLADVVAAITEGDPCCPAYEVKRRLAIAAADPSWTGRALADDDARALLQQTSLPVRDVAQRWALLCFMAPSDALPEEERSLEEPPADAPSP